MIQFFTVAGQRPVAMLVGLCLTLSLLPCLARAQMAPPITAPLDVAAVDAVVARTLKALNVPGIAVAVVKDGQVVLAKGYGVSSLANKYSRKSNRII